MKPILDSLKSFILVLFMIIGLCFVIFTFPRDLDATIRNTNTKSEIVILYWSPIYGVLDHYIGTGSLLFQQCEYKNCYLTYDKNYMDVDEFDALIFHQDFYNKYFFKKPTKRKSRQIYIYENLEPPLYSAKYKKKDWANFFNWTMTYRRDSDLVKAYGDWRVKPKRDKQIDFSYNKFANKSKSIAWMVSQCQSQSHRDILYKKLSRFFKIDVYGKCGTLKCPKNRTNVCLDMIERDYKFYLSFENSLCTDYVTEKMFKVLKRDIIPIVYGGVDYKKFAPPNSVIDIDDFASIDDLANHIKNVAENYDQYKRYFEWKKDFYVADTKQEFICDLCRKLNTNTENKFYGDVYEWWTRPGVCFEPIKVEKF